ncbi:MAG: iron-containing alcohol dehydrogenase [Bacteroidales bacterium]|nr:iron-containing alcohol dehydrogenase [Bacteroidales bacterium]
MENFKIDNPTIVHFGKGVVGDLGNVVSAYGKKVFLVYGKGSVKKNGIYDAVMQSLKEAGGEVSEFSGIRPNPVIGDVDAAAAAGREFRPDIILAVGGGSVLDSAKIISVTIPVDHSGWLFMKNKAKPASAIPVVAVLTLAATGSEMNPFAVIQNHETKEKLGWGNRLCYPAHSFLDPSYTFSVPKDYTAYGITDLMAHALENFFGEGEASLSDRFVFSVMKEAIEYGPLLLNDLYSYRLREKIMYAATMALNGLTLYGRKYGDWGVHSIGHVISLLFDTAHGATLSMAYPAWLKLHQERIPGRIGELGRAVFDTGDPGETISNLEDFFKSIGSPVRLDEAGISDKDKEALLPVMIRNQVGGNHHKLSDRDREKILEYMAGR